MVTGETVETKQEQLPGGETPVVETPAIDYKLEVEKAKEELEQIKADRARLEQQVTTFRGLAHQRLDLDTELRRMRREQTRATETVQTLIKGLLEGDTEVATKAVATLQARHEQEDARDTVTQQQAEIWQDIGEEVAEAYGHDLTTQDGATKVYALLNTSPDLASIRTLAQQGFGQGNMSSLRQALKEAKGLRRQSQVRMAEEKMQTERQKAKQEAEEMAKEKLQAAGVLNMPTPKAAGRPGPQGLQALLDKDVSKMTRTEMADYKQALLEAQKRAQTT